MVYIFEDGTGRRLNHVMKKMMTMMVLGGGGVGSERFRKLTLNTLLIEKITFVSPHCVQYRPTVFSIHRGFTV